MPRLRFACKIEKGKMSLLNRTEFDGESNYHLVSPLAHNKAFIFYKKSIK